MQMNNDYYKSIGFMCGLEIHQRLDTDEKLFCACSTKHEEKSASATIMRRQRAVAGELGSMDVSAQFEERRHRGFVYNVFAGETCLVDIDEEPPHNMNSSALAVALSLAQAMHMRVVDELQPMRKNVIDGSDPSAFQRTVMVALEGKVRVQGVDIDIPSLFVEEESSGIAATGQDSITYDTNRLGIPLIELDTAPTIPNPMMAKAVALYLGTLLRLTGKAQRGIGSIRQDTNISIKDGARVEIKGMQELDLMDKFIENEVMRQQKLLEIKTLLIKAKAKVGESVDVTHLFAATRAKVIRDPLEKKGVVMALALRNFKGMLGREINPNRRLGTEISDYAKMAGVHGIIHSDEDLERYPLSKAEVDGLRLALKLSDKDAFVMVAANDSATARRAIELAGMRAGYALQGIPKETRGVQDNVLCTTSFLRPLPTGSRMYPETDVRPVLVTDEMLAQSKASAPDLELERQRLHSMLKNSALEEQLILSPRLQLFKTIIAKSKAEPDFVANTLLQKFTELRRQGLAVDALSEERLLELFEAYVKGRITKQAVGELLAALAKHDEPVATLIDKRSLHRITGKALKELVARMRKELGNPGSEALRNSIMSKYRIAIDGSELNELLK
jgi:glutamyl-tRNA(Gln) amidotransferase subunit E